METTIQPAARTQQAATATNSSQSLSAYDRLIAKLKFSYFGMISMTILIGSIIGGISAMFILKNDAPVWQLGICMATAMANNVAGIAQAPAKWVANLFIACVAVNAILILMNVI